MAINLNTDGSRCKNWQSKILSTLLNSFLIYQKVIQTLKKRTLSLQMAQFIQAGTINSLVNRFLCENDEQKKRKIPLVHPFIAQVQQK